MSLREDAAREREEAKHESACKYLGNDMWECGHMDNADECDCHICIVPEDEPSALYYRG